VAIDNDKKEVEVRLFEDDKAAPYKITEILRSEVLPARREGLGTVSLTPSSVKTEPVQ
jgi:hypothetical protein